MLHFLLWLLGGAVFLIYCFGVLVLTIEELLFEQTFWAAFRTALIWPYFAVWPDIQRPLATIWAKIRSFFA